MAGKNVLLVDDSMSTRMMAAAMLGKICPDWNLIQAKDGSDALEKVQDEDVDAMLIDVNMPGMDGFELAEKLRVKFPDGHICLLTANIQGKVRDRAAAAGHQFLPKPVTPDELEEFVSEVKSA